MSKYYPPAIRNDSCPIWRTRASLIPRPGYDGICVNSPRAGGKYRIDRTAIPGISRLDDRAKARLTSWLVEQREKEAQEIPEISTLTLKTEGEQRENLSISNRADRLLQWIDSETEEAGVTLVFTSQEMDNTIAAAWSESSNFEGVKFLLDHLCKQGWIKRPIKSFPHEYFVTDVGYNRLEELKNMNDDSTNDDSPPRVFGL